MFLSTTNYLHLFCIKTESVSSLSEFKRSGFSFLRCIWEGQSNGIFRNTQLAYLGAAFLSLLGAGRLHTPPATECLLCWQRRPGGDRSAAAVSRALPLQPRRAAAGEQLGPVGKPGSRNTSRGVWNSVTTYHLQFSKRLRFTSV